MFSIDSENTIRLQQYESSSLFPIIVNKGTKKNPIYHHFSKRIRIKARDELNVRVDIEKFMSMTDVDGTYSFLYDGKKWVLNQNEVYLPFYGIKYNKYYLKTYDTINIFFHKEIDEVYFYIYDYNMDTNEDQYYVKKTFTSDGTIFTEYLNKPTSEIDTDVEVLTEDDQMLLYIDKEDTQYLKPGEYLYEIKVKFYNFERHRYELKSVISQNKFYLIG